MDMPKRKNLNNNKNVSPLDYTHARFPITRGLDINTYFDPNFTPTDISPKYGDIEYMLSKYDTLPYYNNYRKPDNLLGKSVIVYNDRLGDDTNEAIALDALSHGLRELDETYRDKYIPALTDAFWGDANYYADMNGIPLHDADGKSLDTGRKEFIDNYVDGKVRNMMVRDDMRDPLHYLSRQDTIDEYNLSPIELLNALTEAYSYINPTTLPELTVTPNKYSDGGDINTRLDWNKLSMKEKAAYIRIGVANGLKDIDSIRSAYNKFDKGGNLYYIGGNLDRRPLPYVYNILPALFAKDGVNIHVSSGYRPNARVKGTDRLSRHAKHEAADIVGDFAAIRRVLDDPNSHVSRWMVKNGFGYLDETSATGIKRYWKDTKRDHSHYHIGKDSTIAPAYAARMNNLLKLNNTVTPVLLDNNTIVTPTLSVILEPIIPINDTLIPIQENNSPIEVAETPVPSAYIYPERLYINYTPEDLFALMNSLRAPQYTINKQSEVPLTATEILRLQLLKLLQSENNLFNPELYNTIATNIENKYNNGILAKGGFLSVKEKREKLLNKLKQAQLQNPTNKALSRIGRLRENLFKSVPVTNGAQRAMAYFIGKGLPLHAAAGLVGNLMRESSMVPTATNPNGGAYGLALWLGPRLEALFKMYGRKPTFDLQLEFIWHELNTTHKNGLKHLMASKNAAEAAEAALGYYEFSAGPQAAILAALKTGLNGPLAMRMGIRNALGLMGQKYDPTEYNFGDINVPESIARPNNNYQLPLLFDNNSLQQLLIIFPQQPKENNGISILAEENDVLPLKGFNLINNLLSARFLTDTNTASPTKSVPVTATDILREKNQNTLLAQELEDTIVDLILRGLNNKQKLTASLILGFNLGANGGEINRFDGGGYSWTRVTRPNGSYGYVRTNTENKPIDFDENTGYFNIFEKPDVNSTFFRGYKTPTYTKPLEDMPTFMLPEVEVQPTSFDGIQRTPDDHDAYLAQQRNVDAYANAVSPTAGDFVSAWMRPMNLTSPTHLYGIVKNWDSNKGVGQLFDYNGGVFDSKWSEEHPLLSGIGNTLLDVGIGSVGSVFKNPQKSMTTLLEKTPLNKTPLLHRVVDWLPNLYNKQKVTVFPKYFGTPSLDKTISDKLLLFYSDDVFPRLILLNKYNKILSPEQEIILGGGDHLNSFLNDMNIVLYENPYSKYGGFHPGDGNIYINKAFSKTDKDLFDTIIHESEHFHRNLLGKKSHGLFGITGYNRKHPLHTDYTDLELNALAKGYMFDKKLIKRHPLMRKEINRFSEYGAENRRHRANIYFDTGLTGSLLDSYIKNMTVPQLLSLFTSGYGESFLRTATKDPSLYNGMKNAMIVVP